MHKENVVYMHNETLFNLEKERNSDVDLEKIMLHEVSKAQEEKSHRISDVKSKKR
jgi:hypothetical protein